MFSHLLDFTGEMESDRISWSMRDVAWSQFDLA